MKRFNGFIAIVALFVMNSAMGVLPQGVSPQTNYGRFLMGFSRPVITQNNMVDVAWVKGAVMALADDRVTGNNVDNLAVSTMLWRAIENDINYYASLPANRNNSDFRTRIWQSLTRSVDEVRYMKQPRVQPQMTQSVDLVTAGLAALKNFRLQTVQTITTNPSYFYANGIVQPSWFQEAFRLISSNGQLAITPENRSKVKYEVEATVTELLSQLFRNSPNKDTIVNSGRVQVEQFMSAKRIGGVVQNQVSTSNDVDAGMNALRQFREETSRIIANNPTYFYSAGSLQQSWLREALGRLTNNGRIMITAQNKSNLQGEIFGTARDLMVLILSKDPRRLSSQQKDAIYQMVRYQVEQFMNTQQQQLRSRM